MQVVLIDGRNACYKNAYVGRHLRSGDGEETGAIHGVLMGLQAIKHKMPDAKFVVVWDGLNTAHSWRNKLFPDYKSNRRGELPADVKALRASVNRQIGQIKTLFDAISVAQIEIAELEADDVVGILSEKCVARGWPVSIYSSDQDYLQLMPFGARIMPHASGNFIQERDIAAKWHCSSADLLKLRALLGDKSDGIPRAVSGVGPVAAARYIEAGVDPSVELFSTLPRQTRMEAERLESYWPTIHMNWCLMKIVRSCSDPALPASVVPQVVTATRRVLKELASTAPRSRESYDAMIALFAGMDLSSAMENRREIWRLQAVRDGNSQRAKIN
jgi:5'-3' exonuclease